MVSFGFFFINCIIQERRPLPKRSTIDKLKSFFKSQNPRCRTTTTSAKTSSEAINVDNETPKEDRDVQSDNNNNSVPQAPFPKLRNTRRTALSPSLLGELVLMESVRNFILDDIIEEENGEDQDGVNDIIGGTYKAAGGSRVQRQYTISKKKQRVSLV
jgi:hypothetical protein